MAGNPLWARRAILATAVAFGATLTAAATMGGTSARDQREQSGRPRPAPESRLPALLRMFAVVFVATYVLCAVFGCLPAAPSSSSSAAAAGTTGGGGGGVGLADALSHIDMGAPAF